MNPTHTLEIKLFGALREFSPDGVIHITPQPTATIADVKKQLIATFGSTAESYVTQAALATDTKIMADDDSIAHVATLSALPPVCGG